jgi:hypothetical protein
MRSAICWAIVPLGMNTAASKPSKAAILMPKAPISAPSRAIGMPAVFAAPFADPHHSSPGAPSRWPPMIRQRCRSVLLVLA